MPKVKLVVWDLDDTLWDGSVYYRDKEKISLKSGVEAVLKELDKRGIKNSICSKNDYSDVEPMLEKFNIKKYFIHPQVSWGLKSEAIKKLADLTHLDHGEICFIDNDPFERAEVKSAIASLNVIDISDPLDILELDIIKPENETNEDKERIKILKEQRAREVAEKNYGGDYHDFLK